MTISFFRFADLQLLYYFSVVAEENNLTRAAARLFMSQPPLSRHMQQLEERLGVSLFERHTKGLTLTEDGAEVLRIVQPLLSHSTEVFATLAQMAKPLEKSISIGFTTAFEQGIFLETEAMLRKRYGEKLRIVRAASSKLAHDVRSGKLNAAMVALPLHTPGVQRFSTQYSERLVAALPTAWAVKEQAAGKGTEVHLQSLSGQALFWFRREIQPEFFDYTKGFFSLMGFAPKLVEEPLEHDVYLARIAAGEGMGILPASFAAIQRAGVNFCPIAGGQDFVLQLGIIAAERADQELIAALQAAFTQKYEQ